MIYTFEARLKLATTEEELLARDLHLWNNFYRFGFIQYSKEQDEQKLYHYLQAKTYHAQISKSLVNVIAGKHKALTELQKTHKQELETKIKALTKTIKELQSKSNKQQQKIIKLTAWIKHNAIVKHNKTLHLITQKEQALQLKQQKLEHLNEQINGKKVSICFGGKKLFKQRQKLTASKDIIQWQKDWDLARNSTRIAIGDKKTPYGNPEIQYNHTTQKIRIRLSDELVQERLQSGLIKGIIPCRFIEVDCTDFSYLKRMAKKMNLSIADLLKEKPITAKLVQRANGFYVQLSFDITNEQKAAGLNILGIDFNADGLGFVVVKPDGNRKAHSKGFIKLPANTEQELSEQLTILFTKAQEQGCNAVAIESLDFFNKKAHMRTGEKHNKKYHKMLSQMRYQQYQKLVIRKAERLGWQVHLVNPAYSSLTACVKWAFPYRESIDISSGQSIGRQALYGEQYRKKPDLEHVVRHKLKQESISYPGVVLNRNQRKQEGLPQSWKEMARVLQRRQQWKVNLSHLLTKAREHNEITTEEVKGADFDPFNLHELECVHRRHTSQSLEVLLSNQHDLRGACGIILSKGKKICCKIPSNIQNQNDHKRKIK